MNDDVGTSPGELILAEDVLRPLREKGRLPPFILMTAFGDSTVHRDAHDLGALAVLDKPFALEHLRAAAREALQELPVEPS